tara:strand:+ start:1246 stop:1623 length:378 start_codon:yes stop_codon:yes gene_type:complete
MSTNIISLIGSQQGSRDNVRVAFLNEIEDLKDIFNQSQEEWSDFDSWTSLSAQQWIFSQAIHIFNGNKIDICCFCCNYNYVRQGDFGKRISERCYGVKVAFMIEKVLDELIIAKAKRENDGTYSA